MTLCPSLKLSCLSLIWISLFLANKQIIVLIIKESCAGKITFPKILLTFLIIRIVLQGKNKNEKQKFSGRVAIQKPWTIQKIIQSFSGPHTQWSLKQILLAFDAYSFNKKKKCPWGKIAEWSGAVPVCYHVLLSYIYKSLSSRLLRTRTLQGHPRTIHWSLREKNIKKKLKRCFIFISFFSSSCACIPFNNIFNIQVKEYNLWI